jgi:hypothetical protein
MAHDPEVKRLARKVRDLLRSYAQQQSWPDQDYQIFMRARRGGILHVLLVARALNGQTGFESWNHAWEYLRKALCDQPGAIDRLQLGVRSFDQVSEGGLYAIPPDYALLTVRK